MRSYYEIQDRGWRGKHAINNFLGGDFVTKDTCRRACSQVVAALSEATGGDSEDSSLHLHPESGWLSVDVINVIAAGQLGFHVEASSTSLEDFMARGSGAAFLNWNNQHWTVLTSDSLDGPWTHTNSIFEGEESFHGRVRSTERAQVLRIVSDIERHCGGCSLHRVVRARPGGEHGEVSIKWYSC